MSPVNASAARTASVERIRALNPADDLAGDAARSLGEDGRMIARTASIALAAVVAVSLSACVSPGLPPSGPSDQERAARLIERVDRAWANTGLDGTVSRPAIELASLTPNMGQFSECLTTQGIEAWEMSEDALGGVTFGGGSTSSTEQLAFFTCYAQHPFELTMGAELSLAQLDYLYDYYRSWVIPCLALESITVSAVPSRAEFLGSPWQPWNPYGSSEQIRSEHDYNEAVRHCGRRLADLDIWEDDRWSW